MALLLWVLSSALSRGQGFWIFAAGLLAYAAAGLGHRRGRRPLFPAAFFILILATATAVLLEVALHLAPSLLDGRVADIAYTGYHWQRGGIYTLDERFGPLLRPAFRREMYWAGHEWTHETNSDGYRGGRLEQADAVFIGDSMIYGHGVEAEETVPFQFERQKGWRSANLGQQGMCLLQGYMMLMAKGLRLQPQVVFACSHYNDLEESTHWYAPEELQRFLDSPEGQPYLPLARPRYRPPGPFEIARLWSAHVALPTKTGGILGAIWRFSDEPERVLSGGPPWSVPPESLLEQPFVAGSPEASAEDALRWRVHRRAMKEIGLAAARVGARVIFVDLGYPRAFSRQIEEEALRLGAEYSDGGRVALERALRGEDVYLPNDGHWSPAGSRIVAQALVGLLGLSGDRRSPPGR